MLPLKVLKYERDCLNDREKEKGESRERGSGDQKYIVRERERGREGKRKGDNG